MKKIAVYLLIGLVVSAPLLGCAAPLRSGDQMEADMLTIYTSHWPEVYGPIIKEFEERTGIWVTVQQGGSVELINRIEAEQDNPKCDLLFGGGADSHEAYKHLFEPYRSSQADYIPKSFRSPDDTWTAFSALPVVIVYNTKLVKNQPSGWSELLRPEWKGRIAYVSPKVSGSACTALLTMALACPGDEIENARSFFEALDGRYLESSSLVVPSVAEGQFALGVTLEEAAVRQMSLGKDLGICYPQDGTSAVPDAISLVRGAPHPEYAKQFIDFVVSRDIQQMLGAELERRPVRSDVAIPKGLPPLSSLAIQQYDITQVQALRTWVPLLWDKVMEDAK